MIWIRLLISCRLCQNRSHERVSHWTRLNQRWLCHGFLIGIVAGWVYLGASALILRLKIDDAMDAIPVHIFGGAWVFWLPDCFPIQITWPSLFGSTNGDAEVVTSR